jgi:hypothetical protein
MDKDFTETRSKFFSRLNDKNQIAAEQFMAILLEWQEKKLSGKALVHVNTDGVAHKIEPTPSIIIKHI